MLFVQFLLEFSTRNWTIIASLITFMSVTTCGNSAQITRRMSASFYRPTHMQRLYIAQYTLWPGAYPCD